MDWSTFVGDGWNRHATTPEAVLADFAATTDPPPADVIPLAGLLTHVAGEHLARWADGEALLERLRPAVAPGSPGDRALWRNIATLRQCAGDDDGAITALNHAVGDSFPPASHQARVDAAGAAAVAAHGDLQRAATWYQRACALGSGLPDDDPAVRALAVTSNNLALALEQGARSPAADALLRQAAANSRTFWARAGTWLNVERAEYRLAMTHLALGEPDVALRHAQACLDVVTANHGDAAERLFAWEAVAWARLASKDPTAAAALAEAEAALPEIPADWKDYATDQLTRIRQALARD